MPNGLNPEGFPINNCVRIRLLCRSRCKHRQHRRRSDGGVVETENAVESTVVHLNLVVVHPGFDGVGVAEDRQICDERNLFISNDRGNQRRCQGIELVREGLQRGVKDREILALIRESLDRLDGLWIHLLRIYSPGRG